MSAPTPNGGDGSPAPGYYPDPSIPGYVRYWNGASWVPGTSRPAPKEDQTAAAPEQPVPLAPPATPVPPAAPAASAPHAGGPRDAAAGPSAVEETGPVFLDEDPVDEPPRPEPASVWQADSSRQSGFQGAQGGRVAWGGGGAGADPRIPEQGGDPTGGALPGVRSPAAGRRSDAPAGDERPAERPVPDSTVTIRAVRPRATQPSNPQPQPPVQPQPPAQAQAPAPAPVQPLVPEQVQPQPQPQAQAQPPVQPQAQPPVTDGPGGGSASWAQQVHQLAQDGDAEPAVVPWKPPVNDPFLAIAQAQAAARPAPLGRRIAARLIDSVLLGGVLSAIAVPLVTSAVDHVDGKIEAAKQSGETVTVWLLDGTTGVQFGIVLLAFLVLGALYEALPTAKWGHTLGKKLLGLSVVDIESHEPPPFGAALRRWLVYGGLGLVVLGVVNVLWCLIDRPWRQCWHDKAAHTFVRS
ncbi:RDD family protein [Streptomyces sp. NPDC017979]|uniref:RDD family protein n=1 Tax=Streptomyces sp. NPDC017979 TaxID=3365024 RepID=UPI00378B8691